MNTAELWKQYEEAHKADRPQTEADILSKIKAEAVKKRLAADFYDAATKYVEAVQRRDWKKREEARKNLEKEVKDFDEPMVTYLWMSEQAGTPSSSSTASKSPARIRWCRCGTSDWAWEGPAWWKEEESVLLYAVFRPCERLIEKNEVGR